MDLRDGENATRSSRNRNCLGAESGLSCRLSNQSRFRPGKGEPTIMEKSGKNIPLALGALGVVFGDIGTSPLYAMKACFNDYPKVDPTPENVLGVTSLMFWSLMLVISFKYAAFVMRADNEGEGGVLALLALLLRKGVVRSGTFLSGLAVFGAALLYADGFITPAISVLSSVEGLALAAKGAKPFITPIACVILAFLFLVQSRGTAAMGKIMGPVMLLWFTVIAVFGLTALLDHPAALAALNPYHAVHFFTAGGVRSFLVLGSVVLCITGGEALYADMGHFGAGSIRLSWYGLVLPSLVLCYFGQAALLLQHPEFAASPFYFLVPKVLIYPMIALATLATIIASQAIISGVFSLTRQAVHLGYLPRLNVKHTSEQMEGQIFIPVVNVLMFAVCLALTMHFGSSSALAGAYGIAVTATMFITSILYFLVIRRIWKWSLSVSVLLAGAFLCVDMAFFGANLFKIVSGGWIPLLTALGIALIMKVWREGRSELASVLEKAKLKPDEFKHLVEELRPLRTPGMGVFLSSDQGSTPATAKNYVMHFRSLPETIVFLSVKVLPRPHVPTSEQLRLSVYAPGVYRIVGTYGYMQTPNIPLLLRRAETHEHHIVADKATYLLGQELPATKSTAPMGRFRRMLFAMMQKNALSPIDYFGLPPERVVEIGVRVPV